jgi:hypothetical protein
VAKLTDEQKRALVEHQDKLPEIFAAVVARLGAPLEDSVGEGLGHQLDSAEAKRRLHAYASPIRVEDWAGEVAGPGEIERTYGIRRSTLHDWQKQNAVVGLLSGVRKHVFPLAQFVDGRPVAGLAPVVAAAGAARTAWLWLIEPHPSLAGQTPLDRLKAGSVAVVTSLADRDFGQP